MLNFSFPMSEISESVKEGIIGEEVAAAIQSLLGVELSRYGFDPRDVFSADSAYTSTVVNIGGRDLDEMAWWNADLRNV